MRMNKARPTMSGSLIKHRAYLTYIKYNKNVNNNNNNNNISSSSSSNNNNNKKKRRKKLMRTLRWEINVRIKQC